VVALIRPLERVLSPFRADRPPSPRGLDEIGHAMGTERSSLKWNVLKTYESLLKDRADSNFSILDITLELDTALDAWRQAFPKATVSGVFSRNAKEMKGQAVEGAVYSEGFGQNFWLDIARSTSPDFIISDGRVSVYHQMEMFRVLFPVLQPDGCFVFENPLSSPDNVSNKSVPAVLVYDFAASLARESAGGPPDQQRSDDFRDYCLRNIENIEFGKRTIIIRKRSFTQKRILAVPFSQVARDVKKLDEPTTYKRVAPEIHGSSIIAARVKAMLEDQASVVPPRAEVGRLRDAKIIGAGIVIVGDEFVVEESFINMRHTSRRGVLYRVANSDLYVSEDSLSAYRTMPPGSDYVCAKQTWDANYGHWVVDTLPRMLNLQNVVSTRTAKFVLNGNRSAAMKKVFSDSLGILGVSDEQLVWTDHRPVHFEELVYATPMSIPPLIKSPLSIRNLESLTEKVPVPVRSSYEGMRKIYLSRNRYPRRRLLNEEELIPDLLAHGYSIIYPEQLSFLEQIALFSQATHVVGNMGAAFSNLAFSPQAVRVLVLATELMLHDYFYDLVCHKNGRYVALQGVSADKSDGIGSNFEVDPVEFRSILEGFETVK
jgi:hypothetical protein